MGTDSLKQKSIESKILTFKEKRQSFTSSHASTEVFNGAICVNLYDL